MNQASDSEVDRYYDAINKRNRAKRKKMKIGEIQWIRLLRPAMLMAVALATIDSLYWMERFHVRRGTASFYSSNDDYDIHYNDDAPHIDDDVADDGGAHQGTTILKTKGPSSGTAAPSVREEVYFLKPNQLSLHDGFSASWLQRTDDFLTMDLQGILGCEQASFVAFQSKKRKLRMPIDWLDFSVEHLSKWWKILDVFHPKSSLGYNAVMQKLKNYIAASTSSSPSNENNPPPALEQAIAVIAFQGYSSKKQPERGFSLTVLSLAATIKSLWRAGMGRVVIAGLEDEDPEIARHALEYLQNATHTSLMGANNQVGQMEVAFAKVATEDLETSFMKKNIPRAALYGLQHAIKYGRMGPSQRKSNQTEHMNLWLGEGHDPSYWKYVYLTEPDSILQTRPGSLKAIKEEVDRGMVVVPHRFQPVPHESDLTGARQHQHPHVPATGNLSTVLSLDSIGDHDACCDEQGGPDLKPGLKGEDNPFLKSCGIFWYMCPFWYPKKDPTFSRFEPYGFLRLTQGTGIAALAATEHGRRCFPQRNTICKPRHT